jgi:membrane protein DedA with SNARE-associated domain
MLHYRHRISFIYFAVLGVKLNVHAFTLGRFRVASSFQNKESLLSNDLGISRISINQDKNRFQGSRLSKSRINESCLKMSNGWVSSITSCISSISQTTSGGSSVASLNSLTDVLSTTPPMVYFLSLLAAGCGVPVSEDALVIFVGTIIPSFWKTDPIRRNQFLLAIYFGVVLSDFLTFGIGKVMRMGIAGPLRRRMDLQDERVKLCDEEENDVKMTLDNSNLVGVHTNDDPLEPCILPTPKAKKRDRILAKLEEAGDYVGFIIRFSVGIRGPMMLFTGFSNRVPFLKYAIGTVIGAIFSVSMQLLLGYSLRNNPTAVVGAVASISSVVLLVPLVIGCTTSISHLWSRYQLRAK